MMLHALPYNWRMQSPRNKTAKTSSIPVTLPILVPCSFEERHGSANFLSGEEEVSFAGVTGSVPRSTNSVRVLDAEELAGHGVRGKELRNKLRHEQQRLFFHVTALSEALQSSDGVSLAAAYESLTSALIAVPEPHFHDQAIERGGRGFAKYMSRLALERGSGTAGCDLAQLVSTAIRDARLVVWYSDQSDVLRPAFYCPNAACALFVNAVLHLQ